MNVSPTRAVGAGMRAGSRVTLIVFAVLNVMAAWPVAAQAPGQTPAAPADGSVADAWLQDILREQTRMDIFGRYFAAPAGLVLGAGLLTTPLWGRASRGSPAFVTGGALMLTAAIGTWAHSDAYDAQQWNARWSSLGFVGLGVGLLLSCADTGAPCGRRPLSRNLALTTAAMNTGLFLSYFVLSLLSPPPSPRALELSVRGQPPEQRRARVLAFLRERERVRRIGAYITLPWLVGTGISWLAIAPETAEGGGRTLLYGFGTGLLAVSVGLLLFELLGTNDSERLAAGRLPSD